MWEFFIRNNKFASLSIVALIAVGTYSILSIPRESSPEVVIPVGIVSTILPGAPAADVESLITNKLERGLSAVENVKKITSTTQEGISIITVEFEASADVDASIQDLKDTIDTLSVELPSDAEDPVVTEVDFVNQPIMSISVAGDMSDFAFTNLADDLENAIESIPGVSRAETQGVRDREVTIIVDQKALAQYSLSLGDVTSAIRNANTVLPIGQIENNGVSYNVALEGDIADTSDIPNIGITTHGGQPVFVRDVAKVVDGLSPASTLSRLSVDGKPSQNAISINVYKQSGGDITRIAKSVREEMKALQAPSELLDGMQVVTTLDAGEQIEKDLTNLTRSGIETIILVMIVLILTLGWREGVLAGLSVPLSFLFGFIGLYLSGNTINFLSLFALILGIGVLVDCAIVIVEGINRRLHNDPLITTRDAAIATIHEFSAPLISGTFVTAAAFVGLFVVSGVIGQFIASIPFTLIALLFASLVVALAIIPYLAIHMLKRRPETDFEKKQQKYMHSLEMWYANLLSSIVGNAKAEKKFLIGIRIALVVAILLPVFGVVKVVFFEQSNVEYLIVEIKNPEGTTKEVTDIAVRRVEEALYTEEDIASFAVTVGSGNQFASGGSGEKLANIFITLQKDRERTSTEVMEALRVRLYEFRDIDISVTQPSDGPPTGAPITIKFLGEDLVELTRIANESAEVLKGIANTTNVETSTDNNNTEFVLELDRAKIASLGLSPFTVSQIARTAVFGTEATSLTTLEDDIDVVVKLNVSNADNVTSETTNETSIDALTRITIPTQDGDVPLSSLVTLTLRESSTVIAHEDSARIVTITSDVTSEGNAREIQAEAVKKIRESVTIPGEITLSTGGGEADESNKAFVEMILALVVGIVLMIGILVYQFNSYLHTRYVLSIVPYSLIGILFGLAITGSTLSFPSIMGFIALTGIEVNKSILLIDVINKLRKAHPEKSIRDIVIEGSVSRARPVLLTSITTIIGMIPLTHAGDMWAPLAYAVIFGLIFSICITLILIPIAYARHPGELPE